MFEIVSDVSYLPECLENYRNASEPKQLGFDA
jgi:hypothetical protein